MVSVMVNKLAYKPSVKDIMDKYYKMFSDKNQTEAKKKEFSNSPDSPDEEENTLFKCTVSGFMLYTSGLEVVFPLKKWSCRRWVWMDIGQVITEPGGSNDDNFFLCISEVMERELQERCFNQKISNSRLVQTVTNRSLCQKISEKISWTSTIRYHGQVLRTVEKVFFVY